MSTKVEIVAGPTLVVETTQVIEVTVGRQGIQGIPGTDGVDGTDGTDGVDGANGSSIIRNWLPTDASFPASNYATLDTRNTHPVLDFDAAAFESAYFHGVMPDNYETDASVVVEVYYSMTSATTGAVDVDVRLENMQGLDISGNSFASWGGVTPTVPGTAGQVASFAITLTLADTQLDSLTAGDLFRLQVARNGADAGDTASGDMEVHMVEMRIA